MKNALVLVLMGSESDFETVSAGIEVFRELGVPFDAQVASAHRTPALVERLVREGEAAGIRIIVCAAGLSAHLPGAVAAMTTLPVIGVPMDSPSLRGVDALYSIVQMPPGVPVATMGIGKAGSKNAAYMAAAILALSDPALAKRLKAFREGLARQVGEMNARVQAKIAGEGPR